jgi:hypothetical protein
LETTEGWKIGHDECAEFLEREVRELLTKVHIGDENCMDDILKEAKSVITEGDNQVLLKEVEETEVKSVISNSNLKSSPRLDGIPLMTLL